MEIDLLNQFIDACVNANARVAIPKKGSHRPAGK
jgi:hypothetical protein